MGGAIFRCSACATFPLNAAQAKKGHLASKWQWPLARTSKSGRSIASRLPKTLFSGTNFGHGDFLNDLLNDLLKPALAITALDGAVLKSYGNIFWARQASAHSGCHLDLYTSCVQQRLGAAERLAHLTVLNPVGHVLAADARTDLHAHTIGQGASGEGWVDKELRNSSASSLFFIFCNPSTGPAPALSGKRTSNKQGLFTERPVSSTEEIGRAQQGQGHALFTNPH